MKLKWMIVLLMTFTLTGCSSTFEFFEKKEIEKEALEYLEAKYDKEFEVYDSEYAKYDFYDFDMIPVYSNDVKVTMTDGTCVVHTMWPEMFYDDYQTEEITSAINKEIISPMLDSMSDVKVSAKNEEVDWKFNFMLGDRLDGEYFHAKYEGDIKDYLLNKEEVSIGLYYYNDDYNDYDESYLCVLSDNEYDWQTRFYAIQETIETYFTDEELYNFKMVALTNEAYKQEEYSFFNIGEDGIFAIYDYRGTIEQNYIPLFDSVYIMSDETGIVLEEGDLIVDGLDNNEFEDLVDEIEDSYDIRLKKYDEIIDHTESLIYRVRFSKQLKDKMVDQNINYLTLNYRFKPSEIERYDSPVLYDYQISEDYDGDISEEIGFGIYGNSDYTASFYYNIANNPEEIFFFIADSDVDLY